MSAVVRTSETTAPAVINHFNLFRSTELTGAAMPGISSGQAIQEMEKVKADIEASKKQVADIEEEARKAGVPPGWLR